MTRLPLIAAAPDLLRLLIEVLQMVEDDNPPSPSGDWANDVRAAIASATGE